MLTACPSVFPFLSLLQERASEFDDIDAQIEVDDGEQCLMHTVCYTSRMQTLTWTYSMHKFVCVLFGRSCLSLSLQHTCTREREKCSTC